MSQRFSANKNPVLSQPTANGTLHSSSITAHTQYAEETPSLNPLEEAPPPLSDRSEDDDSLTDTSSTNDVSRLLPTHNASAPRKQKAVDLPVVSPPSRHSGGHLVKHHHHHADPGANQKRLSSTRSHAPSQTDAAHIKEVAGDDCCAHCLLACLFCELLSMCSAVGQCLACGGGGACCCTDDAIGCCCCCCVEAANEAACTEDACQAVLDCGVMEENCCGSSDCLEICLECCSICFPT